MDRSSVSEWIVKETSDNLIDWIVVAAESDPGMINYLMNSPDLRSMGVKVERKVNIDRESVHNNIVENNFTMVPENLIPVGIKRLRDDIERELGIDVVNSIVFCGGTARDILLGKDPTLDWKGDFDVAMLSGVDSDVKIRLSEIIRKNINNTLDVLTEDDSPYKKAMNDAGCASFLEMLQVDREFSINKFVIKIGNGEIIDPYGGARDLHEGRLRLVGKNINVLLENEFKEKKLGEAITLALRGVRFATQYGLEIENETSRIFCESQKVNEIGNRLMLIMKGPGGEPFLSEISKCYLKMLEKAKDPVLMILNMRKLGVLEHFSAALDALNFISKINGSPQLRLLSDFYTRQGSWTEFQHAEDGNVWIGEYKKLDIRHIGKISNPPKNKVEAVLAGLMSIGRSLFYVGMGV